jgi:septal ring factor EnvC (AmiA/AmiB activator)
MKRSMTFKAKSDRVYKEVKKAKREIAKLQRELKAGTLDMRRLTTGLAKTNEYVSEIPTHIPIFSKDV